MDFLMKVIFFFFFHKVRKTIKHAFSKMEQPNALPPVHRPNKSESFSSKTSKTSRPFSSRSQGQVDLITASNSIELPIFGEQDHDDDDDERTFDEVDLVDLDEDLGDLDDLDDDLEEEENSASPEQKTVLPKMPNVSRGPHVQHLFTSATATSPTASEAVDTTAPATEATNKDVDDDVI
jgi:hypothetical protein